MSDKDQAAIIYSSFYEISVKTAPPKQNGHDSLIRFSQKNRSAAGRQTRMEGFYVSDPYYRR